ncbi:addiction module killer protein (plasmid) [Piscirickettsia salmonis]|uniref:Addiction module killer protein n=1 Tax=Piscirickettsia salmonis TaxID=1238 RepID=A0AAC8VKV7_PISSA|nr:addiction module killer protein [Piscirickettsia salmonis]
MQNTYRGSDAYVILNYTGNIYVTIWSIIMKVEVVEFLDDYGTSPFEVWFNRLNAQAAAKITIAVTRMELGNFSNCKSVGAGVWENKIDFGPGYRIYYGKDGDKLVILLTGGSKKGQQKDIDQAKSYWKEYKQRKKKH